VGGRKYQKRNGRTVYVIRKTVEGVAYQHTLDVRTEEQARTALFEYIEVFYNRHRRHSSCVYPEGFADWRPVWACIDLAHVEPRANSDL